MRGYAARSHRRHQNAPAAIRRRPRGTRPLRARGARDLALDHPNICALYDVGEHDGTTFLVMEHLEGETLAEARVEKWRAAAGPGRCRSPIEIADALDKAHRAGIVHRDLKPGNIMLTKSGAKLLDFGLAKSAAPVVSTSGALDAPDDPAESHRTGHDSRHVSVHGARTDRGLEADARTDIFAFGAVLYEMITGRRAFEGKTRASLLGAILKDEPPPVSTRAGRRAEGARSDHCDMSREGSGRSLSKRAGPAARIEMGGIRRHGRAGNGHGFEARAVLLASRLGGRGARAIGAVNHRGTTSTRGHPARRRDAIYDCAT